MSSVDRGVGVAASTVNLLDVLWMLPFLVGAAGRWMPDVVVLVSTKRHRRLSTPDTFRQRRVGMCEGGAKPQYKTQREALGVRIERYQGDISELT